MKKISLLILLSMLLALVCGCANGESISSDSQSAVYVPFTVRILTEGGMPMEEVEIRVFEFDNAEDLVWAGSTDEDGYVSFKGVSARKYTAVLSQLPEGYKSESAYEISEDCQISLKTEILDGFFHRRYRVGDVVRDISITDVEGNVYRISELLKTKKAIVLNFWFQNCGPCRMEFPYLQNAYEEYKDEIEVLAINPVDGNDETISDYAKELGLTFPVFSGEPDWASSLGLFGYPTTVVIDRYGMISMSHSGAVTENGVFEKIFGFYTSENYTQEVIRNISDIK